MVSSSRRLAPWLVERASFFMDCALEEARRTPSCDVPVGAIVLDPHGEIIARGHNERVFLSDPTAHAEIQALRAAGKVFSHSPGRLDACSLIVTLEPCTMCAGAILGARIGSLIFGAWEEKTGACGSLFDAIRDPHHLHIPQVLGGINEQKCASLLTDFFAQRRSKH